MISHKHKCIFIHIPRCGGTSIEHNLFGQDWFTCNPVNNKTPYYGFQTKHIYASTAKQIYAEYWNDYFKFAFVRNPWDRTVSLSRFPWFYGAEIHNGKINLDSYLKRFPNGEFDYRALKNSFSNKPNLKGAVYLKYLDEELDFIGRFETINEDFSYICDTLNIPNQPLQHEAITKRSGKKFHYSTYYTDTTRNLVSQIYEKDIQHFNYTFVPEMKRTAYLLSVDATSERSLFSQNILKNIGFDVNVVSCVEHEYNVISNKLSMLRIYETIANATDEWSYVFEDDINITHDVTLNEIVEYESFSKNVFYLGCFRYNYASIEVTTIGGKQRYYLPAPPLVRSLHAVALSKEGAKKLISFANLKANVNHMDVILEQFVEQNSPVYVVSYEHKSPVKPRSVESEHRGLFYQDRDRFPSEIFRSEIAKN